MAVLQSLEPVVDAPQREEFVVEACYLMRDRFLAKEVWEQLDLPVAECMEHMETSAFMDEFRSFLFSRIVPNVKHIGLWGPRVQKAFADMGVLSLAEVDPVALQAEDEKVAENFDREFGLRPE